MVGYPDEKSLQIAGKGPEGAARPRGARGGTPPRSLTGRPDENGLLFLAGKGPEGAARSRGA